jgi:uncharacterized protein YfaS (alpha-2-macroglobulin family)
LEVNTQQTLDQILPKFIADRELSAIGGDGGKAELRNNLNPFKRKTELPVAYWSGIVDTDATPRQLTYQVPDYFNGELKVMAVAVAADAVGAATKTTEIRGDFVINPNVPTFVAPEDVFTVTASIANNVSGSGVDALVSVELKSTPQLEVIGNAQQTLKISEKQEKTATFTVRANALLGGAKLIFMANHGNKSTSMTSTLSVRPASAYQTSMTSGFANNSNRVIELDRKLYPDYREVKAAISVSPLILVVGLQQYLENFPYGCTEQLVSKAMPLLALSHQPQLASDPKILADKMQEMLQQLSQRQMSSGGFSYWPGVGMNESNQFASIYAMHFLTDAREQGYTVPNDVMRAGLDYLKSVAGQNATSLEEARAQAYAIYILTRNEMVTTNYLTALQLYLAKDTKKTWQQDITSAYIAASYQLLKSTAEADRLIKLYQIQKTEVSDATDFYNKDIANAVYLYLIAKHFPEQLARVNNDFVLSLVTAMNTDEINTLLSGYSSLALAAYAQSYKISDNVGLGISETFSAGQEKILAAPAAKDIFQAANVDDNVEKVHFINPTGQNYFYQLVQAGFDKNLPNDIIKQGLEVEREYRSPDGSVIHTVRLGDEMVVHIQVRALNDRYLSHVAIVDLLPGGFEVVRDSLNDQPVVYSDVREDRVVFFSNVDASAKEITYRIKATNIGTYTVPPILAHSMYDPNTVARGLASSIIVAN